MTGDTDHRTGPRRRGRALEEAILDAALAELTEAGYERFSMARVAERARAGKASMYRRWPSKLHLVVAAFYHLFPERPQPPDTGSLRGDLLALLGDAARHLDGPAGIAVRGLVSDALRDPATAAQFARLTRGTSVETMRILVGRAAERGELDAGPITARQLEAGLAVLRYQVLTQPGPVPADAVTGIVDEVVLPLLRAAGAR